MDCTIAVGNIAEQDVDAVVNSTDTEMEVNGGVGVALFRAGGEELLEAARAEAPVGLGSVAVTEGYGLPARYVIHAAVNPHQAGMEPTEESIRKATRAALERAEELGCRTVAFPALGCGVGGFDLKEGARIMLEETGGYEPENLDEIVFVAYDESKCSVIEEVCSSVLEGS